MLKVVDTLIITHHVLLNLNLTHLQQQICYSELTTDKGTANYIVKL